MSRTYKKTYGENVDLYSILFHMKNGMLCVLREKSGTPEEQN